MADVHPTESGAVSQEPPRTFTPLVPTSEDFRGLSLHLCAAIRDIERMRRRAATPACELRLPPCDQGGSYRVYYISPHCASLERELLQQHRVQAPGEMIALAADILSSYRGLMREGVADATGEVLAGMATVLDLALQAICDAQEIYDSWTRVH